MKLIAKMGLIMYWIVAILLSGVVLMLILALQTRMQIGNAHFYFSRRKAELKSQQFLAMAFLLFLGAVGYLAYSSDLFSRLDELTGIAFKPTPTPLNTPTVTLVPTSVSDGTPTPISINNQPTPTNTVTTTTPSADTASYTIATPTPRLFPTPTPSLDLPPTYNNIQPREEPGSDTKIGRFVFAQKIDEFYSPVDPLEKFPVNIDKLYATFDHFGMVDGTAWSFLWRRDGNVLDGGNELWEYGADGRGYMVLDLGNPLSEGRYSAEIWLNGKLVQREYVSVGNPPITPTPLPTQTPAATVIPTLSPLESPIKIVRFTANNFQSSSFSLSATFTAGNIPAGTPWSWEWQYNGTRLDGGEGEWESAENATQRYLSYTPLQNSEGQYALTITVEGYPSVRTAIFAP